MNVILVNNGYFFKYIPEGEEKFHFYNHSFRDDIDFECFEYSKDKAVLRMTYRIYGNENDKTISNGMRQRDIVEKTTDILVRFNQTKEVEYEKMVFSFKDGFINVKETMNISYLSVDEVGLKKLDQNGTKYVGGVKDGLKHGFGELTYQSGSKYIGEFRYGKRHGKGSLVSKKEMYMGEWKDDAKCGYGVVYDTDGTRYEGVFQSNKTAGDGIFKYRDNTYELASYYNDCLIADETKLPRIYLKYRVKDFVGEETFILRENEAYTLEDSCALRIKEVWDNEAVVSLCYMIKDEEGERVVENTYTIKKGEYKRVFFTYIDDDKNKNTWCILYYSPHVLDGSPLDYRFIFSNGSIFDGKMGGLYPLNGHLDIRENLYYDGEFEDGKLSGSGEFHYENGDIVRGEFKDDMPKEGEYQEFIYNGGRRTRRKYFAFAYPELDGADMYKDEE